MRLPASRYIAPRNLDEAARRLKEAGAEAALVGGGTDLFPNMKRKQVAPSVLIGLRNLNELKTVRRTAEGALVLGAGVTLTHLAAHPLVKEFFPSLVDAINSISTPLLRNMGTLGGNLCLDTRCHYINQTAFWRKAIGSCLKDVGEVCLVAPGSSRCWAISSADLPPLLIAVGATIRLAQANGERVIPLVDFYRDDGINYLGKAADEILTEVIIPPLESTHAAYLKLRRRATFDFPVLGVGAALRFNSDGTCAKARVVLGAVTSRPLNMPQAQALIGERMTAELIDKVAEAMALQARPLPLADFTNSYRQRMVSIYVSRLLGQLAN
jgi:4-hydroxybenzoyl-CoA reductase subunit beta